jgi:Family of unknown function (DUF6325)
MGSQTTEIGPVEYIVVGFPGNQFKGEIAPALADLVDAGTIRIIDIAFAGKDESGDVIAFELSALDPDVQKGLENLGAEPTGLFSEEDLAAVAETLDAGSSAAVLAWENVWAKGVAGAIRDAGGELYDYDRVPHEVVATARDWAQANA